MQAWGIIVFVESLHCFGAFLSCMTVKREHYVEGKFHFNTPLL